MLIFKSALLFIIAGICEIGGGYLVWLWLRESKSLILGVLGGGNFDSLWHSANFSTCSFRQGLCRIRRCICCHVTSLGLVN